MKKYFFLFFCLFFFNISNAIRFISINGAEVELPNRIELVNDTMTPVVIQAEVAGNSQVSSFLKPISLSSGQKLSLHNQDAWGLLSLTVYTPLRQKCPVKFDGQYVSLPLDDSKEIHYTIKISDIMQAVFDEMYGPPISLKPKGVPCEIFEIPKQK